MLVEIWSDVVCPWCYIGKRKFEAALAEYEHADQVEIVWKPYQLDPTAPPGAATPVREGYAKKFGGHERADEIIANVTGVAAGVGLDFRMDIALRANTRDAHRLIAFAGERQGAMKERLLQAYFTQGLNIGDHDTLAELAAEVGLDRGRVIALLDSDEGLAELNHELAEAREADITAVPTFVFDGRWAMPGAQEPEMFLRAFRRVEEIRAEEIRANEAEAAG